MRSKLFTSFKTGPLKLKNRFLGSAVMENLCPDHDPSLELLEFHKNTAAGGAGMTTLGCAAVSEIGLGFRNQLLMTPDILPGLQKTAAAVHEEKAAVSIQLSHMGSLAVRKFCGQMPVSASTSMTPALPFMNPSFVRGMTRDEIMQTAADFGKAAGLAGEAGFDAVEIQAGQGELISQFICPFTNLRKDEFGGTLEKRLVFARIVVDEVLKAAGNMAVFMCINMEDGFKEGMQADEALTAAGILAGTGVHGLVLSAGFSGRSDMFMLRGKSPVRTMASFDENPFRKKILSLAAPLLMKDIQFTENYFLDKALRFRQALSVPLIYEGGVVSMEGAEAVLNEGFDAVSAGRALIHDPFFVMKLKKKKIQISECTHCNYCYARSRHADLKCHAQKELPD